MAEKKVVPNRKGGPPKGSTNNPNGRPKGSKNKATTDARKAVAKFVDGNVHRLERWLDRIAKDNPKHAFDCFMSVVEYHIPKLARTELTGENKGPVRVTIVDDIK